MRRFAVGLFIALITFSFSAFVGIQFHQKVACVEFPPASAVSQSISANREDSSAEPQSAMPALHGAEIPVAIKKELDKRFPGWRFPQINPEIGKYLTELNKKDSHPEFISGDFDGNGQPDYAALIEHETVSLYPNENRTKLVVFLTKGDTFKLHLPDQAGEYIALMKKGEKGYSYETDKSFVYKNDSIFTGYWEKGGSTYIFERGKFRAVTTSD